MSNDPSAFVGDIPTFYDRNLGPMIFVDFAEEMARRVAAFAPSSVLETAAGTGIVTRSLRDHLPAATSLVATDLNPPMLAVAATKMAPDDKVTFQPADAIALPFAGESFDMVVCQFGVMFFPDKAKGMAEVHRVLAPGGRYLFSIWDAHRYNPFGRITHEVAGRLFPDDAPQFMNVPFSLRFDPLKDLLIEAGFVGIEAAVLRRDKVIPDVRHFARGAVYGSPLIDQIRGRGAIDPEGVVDVLVHEFEGAFGRNPARMPLQAIVFSATKPI